MKYLYEDYLWKNSVKVDTKLYKLACAYMALTELYDRTFAHTFSNQYAWELRNLICDENAELWRDIINEIGKYHEYSADKWIDEWNRLKNKEIN